MLSDTTAVGEFSDFIRANESSMRRVLTAAYGSELGREATAEALAYGWQHWERLRTLGNPAGYLVRVGLGKARRMKRKGPLVTHLASAAAEPWVEPGLARALAKLSERQRTVVGLIHGFAWSMSEVAEYLGITKASVQTHEARAMKTLQRELGVGA